MIKISTVSYNKQRALEPLSAVFGSDGATLGRSEENFFVLPDAKHLVSRVQASVKSVGQEHRIVSLSRSNPVVLNGRELEFEREYVLQPGDEIQVGPYVLCAEAHLAPVSELPKMSPLQSKVTPPVPVISDAPVTLIGSTESESDPLLEAFLRGAGISELTVPNGLTPEFMETIGSMLAASIDGTFALISSRASSKREVNAEATMVVVRNNNPLKFLQDSKAVLMQMLRKKMPGFMAPQEAIVDDFLDLHAHQEGTAAGMHGVIDALLKRLDPAPIEAAAPPAGLIEGWVPPKRMNGIWQQSKTVYEKTSREARGDFQKIFGAAFLSAYEAEIERIHDACDDA
jgi:FHA domain-containing protein